MPRRLWAVLRKELQQIFRDRRTVVLALLIPVILLLLFGFAVTFDVNHLRLAVVDPLKTPAGRQVRAVLDATDTFDLVAEPTDARQVAGLLDAGRVDVAVVLPAGLMGRVVAGKTPSVQALVNGSDSTLATRAEAYLNAAMAGAVGGLFGKFAAARPGLLPSGGVRLQTRVLYNPALESRNFFVPGLMVIIIMLVAVLVTSMAVGRERERGTLEQLVVSPVRPLELMIGKMVPYGLITFMDVLLVLAVGYLAFGVEVKGSLGLLLTIAAVFLMGCLGLGLFISAVSTTQQNAFLVSLIATLLPTFILSGFIFPIDSMPAAVRPFTYLVPARYFLIVVRSIILKGTGLDMFWEQVVFLLAFALVTVGLAASRFRKRLE